MPRQLGFCLNSKQVRVEVEDDDLLVDVLRDKLGLTGTKKACGTGDCGACTVIVNGAAVRSCIMFACMVEGKEVFTIEGLGSPEKLHPIQQAFVDEGAVQCGFCTPGMILTVKALLDKNPSPNEEDIKDALAGNLCRCTGYTKIIKAVKTAAKDINKESRKE